MKKKQSQIGKYLQECKLNEIKDKADRLLDLLSIKSDYLDEKGCPLAFRVIVCIDDDKTSAYEAAILYHQISKIHGYYPQVLAVGGRGMLSRFYFRPEGKVLAKTLIQLGVRKSDIQVYCKGRNSGENMLTIYEHMQGRLDDLICFCVTKRLGLRTKLTQQKQAPLLKAHYHSINEHIEKMAKWLNYKRLGNMKMLFEEIGAIYPRCVEYSGTFQAEIPEEILEKINTPEIEYKKIIDLFSENYSLRTTRGESDKLGYVKLVLEFIFSIPKAREENKVYIETYREKINNI